MLWAANSRAALASAPSLAWWELRLVWSPGDQPRIIRRSALLRAGINLLRIKQPAIVITLEGVLEEGALGGQKFERLLRFGIVQDGFDEADRIGAPPGEHHS